MTLCRWVNDLHLYDPLISQLELRRELEDFPRCLTSKELATLNIGKDSLVFNVDIQHFKPEEVSVKVLGDNTVTIEGKHEEKQDKHGYIFRHFVRKYVFPENYDVNKIKPKLSSDGVLTITACKVNEERISEHREIPIQQTGQGWGIVRHLKNLKHKLTG
ncbi:hypothetical protein NQ314_003569 [Rhamnusium bicolor]|uniref:SHSP domain-containing protein n=1 Tax=Rhamnusium bicolor TaxID=1586634 RepID=A0AAV8ZNQ2_9CUCU|nr:hypothetical protein NQ314_003569 [Rhamnusium bicolor]